MNAPRIVTLTGLLVLSLIPAGQLLADDTHDHRHGEAHPFALPLEADIPAFCKDFATLSAVELKNRIPQMMAVVTKRPSPQEGINCLGHLEKRPEIEIQVLRYLSLPALLPAEPPSLTLLSPGLTHPTPEVRRAAAAAVGRLFRGKRIEIPALLPLLNDTDPQTRYRAAEALGVIGIEEVRVSCTLAELFSERIDLYPQEQITLPFAYLPMNQLEHAAVNDSQGLHEALTQCDQEKVLTALLKALQHPKPQIRRGSIDALDWLGSPDGRIPTALQNQYSVETDSTIRGYQLLALNNRAVRLPLQFFEKSLSSTDPIERAAATQALATTTADTKTVLATITRQQSDPDVTVRVQAAGAIGALGRNAEPLIPSIRERLSKPDLLPIEGAWLLKALDGIGTSEAIALRDATLAKESQTPKSNNP